MTAPLPPFAPYRRFAFGEFTVTSLLAGSRVLEAPAATFGLNASPGGFEAAAAEAFLPLDRSLNFFTPTLVDTGRETVLFDTGLEPAGILAALAAAGRSAAEVDVVVLTHMHGDHIGGLADAAGALTFPQARYVTGALEFDHWAGTGNETFEAKMHPLAERTRFLDDGGQVAGGIEAILAAGHTPGHMAYRLESAGHSMILTADTANHFAFSLARPDWEVRFDIDRAAAVATRKRLFGMIAAERLPFIGFHMPFPGLGYVETTAAGFRYVPASYQMTGGL